jgi:hypothetical protein
MNDMAMMHGIWQDAAIYTASATILGAIVVFVLLFLVLERKKKTLIFVLLMVLAGYGIFYWHMGSRDFNTIPPVVGPTVMNTVKAPPVFPPRPHVKKQARPACPVKVAPYNQ